MSSVSKMPRRFFKAPNDKWVVEYGDIEPPCRQIFESEDRELALAYYSQLECPEWEACQADVDEFLKRFRTEDFFLSKEFSMATVTFGRLDQRVQAETWHQLLLRLVDRHESVEVDWCEREGVILERPLE